MPILFLLLLLPGCQSQVSLHVIVHNVQIGKGSINVALFANKKDFLKTPVTSQIKKADQVTMEFDFTVPPGDYAIAAYQDLNENKKLDAGLFHIPKEPYGFSNDYRPKMSAPDFEDCRIRITWAITSIIHLK